MDPADARAAAPGSVRGLVRSSAGIAVAMGIQNVAAYGFTILAAWRLGPSQYGAVASLMGLLLVVVVPSLGLQATGARAIAANPSRRPEIEAALMSATYRAALGLGALCLLLTPLIVAGLQLSSWTPALMIGLSAVPLTVIGGQSGVLQGESRWSALGALYLSLGVGRLAIGAVGMWISETTIGAMAGVAVAAWLPALVGALALGHVGRGAASHRTVVRTGERMLREVLANSHALFAFFALSNTDIVVARLSFDDHQAGLYAGGLILTKAVLFLPQFVVVIAFPSMASGRTRVYLKGLAVVAGVGAVATLGAALLSGIAVTFIGGSDYREVEPLIGWFALLGTVLAMVQLMVYEVVARQHRGMVWLLWAGLVAVAATGAWVDLEKQLLWSVLVVDTLVLAALVLVSGLVPAVAGADRDVEGDGQVGS
ncbi:MAG TPA: polysaccharide biosynthesis protein [Propionibacteriaceae bacterium]|nr:polysaccharide biosynthesis protein [Propionibacteriaceae bacterium]